MKVALFKSVDYAHASETPCSETMEGCKGYVRTTEYVDVEFPPLAESTVIESQVAALEAAAAEIQAKAHDAVQNIKARIMELRCLTNEVQS